MIYDTLKNYKGFTRHTGEYGIEIETESKGPYELPVFAFWNVVDDGSLRHFGKEYVLKHPVKFERELEEALIEFRDKTSGIKFLQDQPTTSVHVHVNMLNESFRTMGNFITLYTLFENLLIRYSGDDRRSNLFCLPIVDAEETFRNAEKMFQWIEAKMFKQAFFAENAVKYAALNLASFGMRGSIELRSFRGVTDIKTIRSWLEIIHKIVVFSRKDQDPRDIMRTFQKRGDKFIEDVFEECAKLLHVKDEHRLLEKNIYYASVIAHSLKNDWKDLDIIKEPYKPKQKELEQWAQKLFKLPFADLDPGAAEHVIMVASKEAAKIGKSGPFHEIVDDAEVEVELVDHRDDWQLRELGRAEGNRLLGEAQVAPRGVNQGQIRRGAQHALVDDGVVIAPQEVNIWPPVNAAMAQPAVPPAQARGWEWNNPNPAADIPHHPQEQANRNFREALNRLERDNAAVVANARVQGIENNPLFEDAQNREQQ